MMKILFLFFVLLCNYSYSQDSLDCTVFVNEEGEVIVIDQERISFRFNNRGGLITYSYFTGRYVRKKRNEYRLCNDENQYAEVEEKYSDDENSIKICLYDRVDKPIYSPIVIDKSNGFEGYKWVSDEFGCILIPLSTIHTNSTIYTTINVLLLGNYFKQELSLKKGKSYNVRLRVPRRYGIQNDKQNKRKYLKIEYVDEEHIRVYDSFLKKWISFRKSETRGNCHEAIFEE